MIDVKRLARAMASVRGVGDPMGAAEAWSGLAGNVAAEYVALATEGQPAGYREAGASLIDQQGIGPVANAAALHGNYWPDEDKAEVFDDTVRRWRQEGEVPHGDPNGVVHNHGPEEGPGVECPEYLIGKCLVAGHREATLDVAVLAAAMSLHRWDWLGWVDHAPDDMDGRRQQAIGNQATLIAVEYARLTPRIQFEPGVAVRDEPVLGPAEPMEAARGSRHRRSPA